MEPAVRAKDIFDLVSTPAPAPAPVFSNVRGDRSWHDQQRYKYAGSREAPLYSALSLAIT